MAPDEDDEEGEGYEGTLAETNLQDRSRKKKAASQNALYDVGESESETENGPEGPAQTALYDVGADESSVMTTKLINVPRPNSEVATLLMGKKKRSSIDLSQVLSSRNLGQRVTVKAVGSGVLTFVGPHHLHGDVFCGVELDEPRGESDGIFEVSDNIFLIILLRLTQSLPISRVLKYIFKARRESSILYARPNSACLFHWTWCRRRTGLTMSTM